MPEYFGGGTEVPRPRTSAGTSQGNKLAKGEWNRRWPSRHPESPHDRRLERLVYRLSLLVEVAVPEAGLRLTTRPPAPARL